MSNAVPCQTVTPSCFWPLLTYKLTILNFLTMTSIKGTLSFACHFRNLCQTDSHVYRALCTFPHWSCLWVLLPVIPARDLCESRCVPCQSCVWTGSLSVRSAAVMVGIAEVSLLIANHLHRLTQLNQCRGQTCQAGYSKKEENKM